MSFPLPFMIFAIAIASAMAAFCAPAMGREDERELVWAEQLARTPRHAFFVQLASYQGQHAAMAIRVVDRETAVLVQEITKIDGLDLPLSPSRFVRLVDANADGHPDIQLSADAGGAGPNNTAFFYLFDPQAGQYRFHAGLSELTQIAVAPDGTIESASRGSCCHHAAQTHRFINGELTLIKSWEEALTPDGKWFEVTSGVLKNGKMRYKSRRRRPPVNY